LRGEEKKATVSPDLGRSEVEVELNDSICFPGGECLSWDTIFTIAKNVNNCFHISKGEAVKIQEYSETYGRVYTLYPTESAPTMLVSGIPMHRIKEMNPWKDTRNKIKAYGRIQGYILDTATGLGYTAIMSAEKASWVTTIELDPVVQVIASRNPWSQELFDNPKITQLIGDAWEVIAGFEDGTFHGIIHDPPMFNLAGELYSTEFYHQAFRVLKTDGRMFHYIGNPESKSGRRITRGVVTRLEHAGFSRILSKPTAFGVLACK
jgi:predicted methyltransferase